MIDVHEAECAAAGKDPKAVASLARKLGGISREMNKLGVYVFGGSGTGTIRFNDGRDKPLVLAHCGQGFDGGDGACNPYGPDGLLRGE